MRRRVTPARKYTSERRIADQQDAAPDAGLTMRKRKRCATSSSAASTQATAPCALESSAPTVSAAAAACHQPGHTTESHTRRLNLARPDDADAPSTRPIAPTECSRRPSPVRPERNRTRCTHPTDQYALDEEYVGAPFTCLDGPNGTNDLTTQAGDQSSPSPTADPAAATYHEDETMQVDSDATIPDTADVLAENARGVVAAPPRAVLPRHAAQPPTQPPEPRRLTRTSQRPARDLRMTRLSTRYQQLRRVEQIPFQPPGPAVPRSDVKPVTATRITTATRKPSPKQRPVPQTRVPAQTSTSPVPEAILASSSPQQPQEASLEGLPDVAAGPASANPEPFEADSVANGSGSVPVRTHDIQVYTLFPPGPNSTSYLASRARLAVQGAFGPSDPTHFTRYDLSLDPQPAWDSFHPPPSKSTLPSTSSQSVPPRVAHPTTSSVGKLGPSVADSQVEDAIPSSFPPELDVVLVPAENSAEQPPPLPSWTANSVDAPLGNDAQQPDRATQSAQVQAQAHRTRPSHGAVAEDQPAMETQADPSSPEPHYSERVRLSSEELMQKLARGWVRGFCLSST